MPCSHKTLRGGPIEKIVTPISPCEPFNADTVPKINVGLCDAHHSLAFACDKSPPPIDFLEEPTPLEDFFSMYTTVRVDDLVSFSRREVAEMTPVVKTACNLDECGLLDQPWHQVEVSSEVLVTQQQVKDTPIFPFCFVQMN
jgi:hypothetical protein